MIERKKLYKKGKLWCVALLTTVVTGIALGGASQSVLADSNSIGDTSVQHVSTVTQTATADSQPEASQTNYNQSDHGNYACLDSAKLNDQAQLTVSGWHATNAAQDRPYHYIIAYDSTNHRELSRQNITDQEVSRPDVQQVHNVYNANNSGFNVTFNLRQQLANLQNVQIISRYTNDQAGNGNAADYWFSPITIDQRNYGNLDSVKVVNNQLELSGWHATNQSTNKPYHYIILLDRSIGREVGRILVRQTLQRDDVAKVYPNINGAGNSGFRALFNLNGINFNHQLQALSRFSSSADGNSGYSDYYFPLITNGHAANQGYLDQFNFSNNHSLIVSGWHANDLAAFEPYQHIIIYDMTANRQVATTLGKTVQRPDVSRVLPQIKGSASAGFFAQFDLAHLQLFAGHQYAVISRYSTSQTGNGDQGSYTDYWSQPVTISNEQGANIDNVAMTKEGLQLSGWMASNQAISRPYAFLIVLNDGREVGRQSVQLTSRPDVARYFNQRVYNCENSGFNTLVHLNPASLTGTMQIILRFSADPTGNSNYTDQYSHTYATSGHSFDQLTVNNNTLTVSGWDANNQSYSRPYQFIIVLDQNSHELARTKIDPIARPDVARQFPYIFNSAQSGFQTSLNIANYQLAGHLIKIIHRFSSDVNGNSDYVDCYGGYYLAANGQPASGITRINGETYYFDYGNHQMVTNSWIDGVYFGNDGRLSKGQFSARVIQWFVNHEGKLTYSRFGARDGSDGTADCSGAMTVALNSAGASQPTEVYTTRNIGNYLVQNGYHLVYQGDGVITPEYGDIIIWRDLDRHTGNFNHIVIASGSSANPQAISVSFLTHGKPGTAVQEMPYNQYWRLHGSMGQQVYRLINQGRN